MADACLKNRKVLPEGAVSYHDLVVSNYPSKFLDKEKHLVIDCDGILTTGILGYTEQGKTMKFFGGQDKEAICILLDGNWKLHFVTDDRNGLKITEARMKEILKLGYDEEEIDFRVASPYQRKELVLSLKNNKNIDLVGFIGDSLSDIAAMSSADFSGTTASSNSIVEEYCNIVSNKRGGEGGLASVLLTANEAFIEAIEKNYEPFRDYLNRDGTFMGEGYSCKSDSDKFKELKALMKAIDGMPVDERVKKYYLDSTTDKFTFKHK